MGGAGRAFLALPLSVRGAMLGGLAFDSLRAERTCSDEPSPSAKKK